METEQKLTFDLILPLVSEAEEALWRRGDVSLRASAGECEVPGDGGDTLPMTLLRHGSSVSNTQRYFSSLESRKCCLNLAAGQTTFNNIRLVHVDDRDSGIEEGAMSRQTYGIPLVDQLQGQEYEAYSRAVLCAEFPVLCVPGPPPALSPISPVGPTMSFHFKSKTNLSSSDLSATSDSEDTMASIIPMETLCELLRQAFGLTRQRASQYQDIIHGPFRKKTPAKVLVEELVNQLSLLENNKHPFYHPRHFLSRSAYDQWKQSQRKHLGTLINKFWHLALPTLKSCQHYESSEHHEDYKLLLNKLIRYERSLKENGLGRALSAPLSTVSLRLLKEFGLRYSIGELYRRAVYLSYLTKHFEHEYSYVQHMNAVLLGVIDAFPPNRNRVIMVQIEYNLLYEAAMILHGQCQNSLTRIKRLFPGQQPQEGVGSLIELLTNVLELKAYLLDRSQNPVTEFLTKYAKVNFATDYESQKMIVVSDLKMTGPDYLSPKLLNRLLSYMRDEVTDYKNNYHTVFQKYFHVGCLAAQCFYSHMMNDVSHLCQTTGPTQSDELDLQMLSLAYRLNQLDLDWKVYIPVDCQVWRQAFRRQALTWMDVLKVHCERLTMQALGQDKFQSLKVKDNGVQAPWVSRPSSSSMTSASSLSHSMTSAFNQVKASDKSRTAQNDQSLSDWLTDSMHMEAGTSFTPDGATVGPPPITNTRQPQQEKNSETSFIVTEFETSFTMQREPTPVFTEESDQKCQDGQTKGSVDENVQPSSVVPRSDRKPITSVTGPKAASVKVKVVLSPSTEDLESPPVSPQRDAQHPNSLKKTHKRTKKSASVSQSPCRARGDAVRDDRRRSSQSGTSSTEVTPPHFQKNTYQYHTSMEQSSPDDFGSVMFDVMSSSDDLFSDDPTWFLEVGVSRSVDQTPSPVGPGDGVVPPAGKRCADAEVQTDHVDFLPPTQNVCKIFEVSKETEHLETIEEHVDNEPQLFLVPPMYEAESSPEDVNLGRSSNQIEVHFPQKLIPERDKTLDSLTVSKFSPFEKPIQEEKKEEKKREENKPVTVSDIPGSFPIEEANFLSSCSTSLDYNNREMVGPAKPLSGVLPVSGSVIDVTCMVRRIISFTRTLCQTICPVMVVTGTEGRVERWVADWNVTGFKDPRTSETRTQQGLIEARRQLCEKMIQVLSAVMCLYADNMLTFDLCGTREHVARKIVGPQLVDRLKSQYDSDRVWGCRHMARGNRNCTHYDNRKANFLADKYEPITQEMCIRINNLNSLCDVIPQFQIEAQQAVDIPAIFRARQKFGPMLEDDLIENYFVVEVCPPTDSPGLPSPRSASQTSREANVSRGSSHGPHGMNLQDEVELVFGHCRYHLQRVDAGLVSILAYRVNLFFQKALTLLLELGLPLVGIEARLQPLTAFLDNHMRALSQWLYSKTYDAFVQKLWAYIAEDFETETLKLTDFPQTSNISAKVLLQAVAFFISYFHKEGAGVNLSDLTAKVMRLMYWLQLHTRSTPRLINLYRQLFANVVDGSDMSSELTDDMPSKFNIQKMRADLHAIRKCFSGHLFVDWVLSNQTTSALTDDGYDSDDLSDGPQVDEHVALELAQKLLDRGIIATVDSPIVTSESVTPVLSTEPSHSPYPGLSVYSYSKPLTQTSLTRAFTASSSLGTSYRQGLAQDKLSVITSWSSKDYEGDSDNRSSDSEGRDDLVSQLSPVTATTTAGNETDGFNTHWDIPCGSRCADKMSRSLPMNFTLSDVNTCGPDRSQASVDDQGKENTSTTNQKNVPTFCPRLVPDTPTSVKSVSTHSDISGTFCASDLKFYRFTSICDDLGDITDPVDVSLPSSNGRVISDRNHSNTAIEAYSEYNVTPQFVLQILAKRQKVDKQARQFLKQLAPEELQERTGLFKDTGCFGCSF